MGCAHVFMCKGNSVKDCSCWQSVLTGTEKVLVQLQHEVDGKYFSVFPPFFRYKSGIFVLLLKMCCKLLQETCGVILWCFDRVIFLYPLMERLGGWEGGVFFFGGGKLIGY